MDRTDYLQLRSNINSEIHNALNDISVDPDVLTNSVMRLLLQSLSSSSVKAQKTKRQFLTFRRDPNLIPPSWAYRKPGSTQLPTL